MKRFHLVPEPMTVESGLLTPKMSVKRTQVREAYAADIERLYTGAGKGREVEAV